MARWFVASNITPADDNSLQACPNPGAYTDLDDGDKAMVMIEDVLTTYTYDASSALVESLPQVITPDGNAGNGRWILGSMAATGQNGFDVEIGPQSDSLATLGVVGTTFTLTHVADYSFYINGVKFTKTGNETVEITDVEGLHYIYFDSEGDIQIQAPGGTLDDLILYNCLIAAVYWDATNNEALLLFDERHGTSMSPATHYHLHETIGAAYDEGLALSGFDTDGDGTAATHAQFDLGTGTFHDEDNELTIAADADATIDTFYRLGVGGPWRKITATAGYPVCDPQTGTRMDWNDYNGGTWQLAEVTNNQFVLTHYFATNDVLGGGVIGIMGQAEYTNIVQARTGAETELNALLTGDLPLPEMLPIATVIWKTTNTSTNQVAGAIYSVSGGGDYIDWRSSERTGAAASVSDHESLSGLQGGASGDHYHVTGAEHTSLTGEIIDGSDTDLHQHDTLEYSGITVAEAAAAGVDVLDSSGSDTYLNFKSSASVLLGILQATASDMYMKLGASSETAIRARLNGAVELYYNALKAFATSSEGIVVQDTSGTFPNIKLLDDAGTFLARFSTNATIMSLSLWNGSSWENTFNGTLNGAAKLYYDGVVALETTSDGISTPALKIDATTQVDSILDEDDMASDSATALATQQSIKAYVRDNAGDPALPKLDFYQDWLQETKYQNASVVTCVVEDEMIDTVTSTMDFNIEEKRYDFTAGESLKSANLYDSDLSLTNITECICDVEVSDSGSGTIQLSNNGGTNYITVTDTSEVQTFVTTGTDLRIKYIGGGTGYVTHMGVLYNPDTVFVPTDSFFDPSTLGNGECYGEIALATIDTNSVGVGAALYMASDGNFDMTDSDAVATMPCRALAVESGTGSNKKVLLKGWFRDTSLSMTPGGNLFVHTTTGELSQTIPSGSSDVVQIVGFAWSSDTIRFTPGDYSTVEIT